MSVFSLCAAIVGATLLWVISRWAMDRGANPRAYGLWIAVAGALCAGTLALATGESLGRPAVWGYGALIGVAYGIGYCWIVLYCL